MQKHEVFAVGHVTSDADTADIADALAARTDRRAFLPLCERYVDKVFRYCNVRLGTRALAEDATSEVFLKALDKLPAYRGGSFAAWIFAITRNVVRDHHRRKSSEPLGEEATAIAGNDTADALAIAGEQRRAIHDALSDLSKDQRDLIELQLTGWNDREIAEALGKSRDAIKMLRLRATKRLRERLAKAGWDVRDWAND